MRTAFILPLALVAALTAAQDRLPTMPRFDRYEKLRRDIGGSVTRGDVRVDWADDSKSFTYQKNGKRIRYETATGQESEATDSNAPRGPQQRGRGFPQRGRQFATAISPDGKMTATCRDRNVFISEKGGTNEIQITTDGSVPNRLKNGTGSWVYGEELGQREAMWWSPDGRKLAYYHFDESKVPDYYLQENQVKIQDTLDTEAYPKAGAPNPVVSVFVYDLDSKKTIPVDTGFGDPTLAEYVYDVRWSDDGKELWFNRTNRRQNILEWVGCDPATGHCHVIYREENPNGWVDNHLSITWLPDHQRFLMISEKDGFRNLYLHKSDGTLIRQVTKYPFEVASIVQVDAKQAWIMARDGATPYRVQLHRVSLDGKTDKRLTDPAFNHRVQLSPDGKYFVDEAETVTDPPTTTLRDATGKALKVLAESDLTKFNALNLKKTEPFTFTAADGKTICYGTLDFPSDFDPSKKYPLVVSVYGGPESGTDQERFRTPDPVTEFGFLHASFDGRITQSRGRAFRQAGYLKLGQYEIDDQAAGVKELAKRPYVDGARVGIYGTSYGGYASLMCLVRYPDVFVAASSSSPVTDWRNYDSIYTERYMWIPQENEDGYKAGSAMTYAQNLKGKLLLYWGTADNNVHPSNSLQFIRALSGKKSFDVWVGPDQGHSGVDFRRMWEFFIDHLILEPDRRDPLAVAWKVRRAMK